MLSAQRKQQHLDFSLSLAPRGAGRRWDWTGGGSGWCFFASESRVEGRLSPSRLEPWSPRPCPPGHWMNPERKAPTPSWAPKRLPLCRWARPVAGSRGAVPGPGRWSAALESLPQTHGSESAARGPAVGRDRARLGAPFPSILEGSRGDGPEPAEKAREPRPLLPRPGSCPRKRCTHRSTRGLVWRGPCGLGLGPWSAGIESKPFSATAPGRRLPGHPPQPRTAQGGGSPSQPGAPGLTRGSGGTRRGRNGRVCGILRPPWRRGSRARSSPGRRSPGPSRLEARVCRPVGANSWTQAAFSSRTAGRASK